MRYFYRILSSLFAATLLSTAAQAADFIDSYTLGDPTFQVSSGDTSESTFTASFFNGFSSSGTFDDTYSFDLSQWGTGSVNVSTSFAGSDTTLTITDILINGVEYTADATGSGWYLIVKGIAVSDVFTNTIVIEGTVSGSGSYSGNLTFEASAVPEPATWALFLGGFGLAGSKMRRRRSPALCVA